MDDVAHELGERAEVGVAVLLQEREHVLEGLKICVDNIDAVIRIIRGAATTEEAGAKLRERFGLSERQSQAILDMRLAKLTGLEREKLEAELAHVRADLQRSREALSQEQRVGIQDLTSERDLLLRERDAERRRVKDLTRDRKSTRLNSSHRT